MIRRIAARRPGASPVDPTDPETPVVNRGPFAGKQGINIMWPFMGPLVNDPNNPNTTYQANPFTNPSDFATHIPRARLDELVSLGFDHVRLNVAPGPWQEAITQGNAGRLIYLFGLLEPAIDALIDAGLGCMIDMHPTYYVIYQPQDILAGGINGALFQSYRQTVIEFAKRFKEKRTDRFMLELFNEPVHQSSINGPWSAMMLSLYQACRANMPDHTIGCTMENYSSINELIAHNPSAYDSNTYWVIHPYIPAIFPIQGYNFGTYNKYVFDLAWPPNPAHKQSHITAMTARVNADSSLSAGDKTALIASQTQELNYYFDVPLDKNWIANELVKVSQWCAAHGIHPSRIIANEYGVTRTNSSFTGAPESSRVAWINDMSAALKAAGFKRTLFALDAPDYGITSGTGSTVGTISAPIITALQL